MLSTMVQEADYIPQEEKGRYSELQVMRSAAGWYVGTVYINPEGFQEPGSRDSGYFPTKETAERHLTMLKLHAAEPRMEP